MPRQLYQVEGQTLRMLQSFAQQALVDSVPLTVNANMLENILTLLGNILEQPTVTDEED